MKPINQIQKTAPRKGRFFTQKTLTVPGMVEPLSKLVRQYNSGMAVSQLQGGYYDDYPDISTLDIQERKEFIEKVTNELTEKKDVLKKAFTNERLKESDKKKAQIKEVLNMLKSEEVTTKTD